MLQVSAISPLDGRYLNKVEHLQPIVSEYGLTKFRIKVEIEWFKYLFTIKQCKLGTLTLEQSKKIDAIYLNFNEKECAKVKQIENTTNHDVKAVEYYLKQKLAKITPNHLEYIHFACTSEDINNLSYALMLVDAKAEVEKECKKILSKLLELANKYKRNPMLSRTHGQPATPTTMGKEIYNVYYRLSRQYEQLKSQEILGKINGAVGNYNAHSVAYPEVNWPKVCQNFVEKKLHLTFNPFTTQIEPHDYIAEFFDTVKRINTILIDLNRDMWGYISLNYFTQKVVAGEVGSSTMPHKVNPIDFENSEGNLGLSNALAIFMAEKLPISRFQRDLTDSTVLRNIGVAISYAVLAYRALLKGLDKVELNSDKLALDLQDQWMLLAEPIQTVMRKYKIEKPYEKLKKVTRGKDVDFKTLNAFIAKLDIPNKEKDKLCKLTPANYIGFADKLF